MGSGADARGAGEGVEYRLDEENTSRKGCAADAGFGAGANALRACSPKPHVTYSALYSRHFCRLELLATPKAGRCKEHWVSEEITGGRRARESVRSGRARGGASSCATKGAAVWCEERGVTGKLKFSVREPVCESGGIRLQERYNQGVLLAKDPSRRPRSKRRV
ncbi:hypothetical protein B0H19DRAFT_1232428 [Mycena capillaripes]|nr:hypothetical protein B0H19DRAFT_1232428 [Mycena capillaripes]